MLGFKPSRAEGDDGLELASLLQSSLKGPSDVDGCVNPSQGPNQSRLSEYCILASPRDCYPAMGVATLS